jgi:hypothetical protein
MSFTAKSRDPRAIFVLSAVVPWKGAAQTAGFLRRYALYVLALLRFLRIESPRISTRWVRDEAEQF